MATPTVFQVEPLNAPAKMPERVTQALLQLIRGGTYCAGTRLPSEAEMSKSFGVSRTVIREAVARLKSEGLVASRQGSGVYVREIGPDTPFRIDPASVDSIQAVLQITEIRRGLEAEIAALAAERASRAQVAAMRVRLRAIDTAIASGGDGVAEDMEFHRSIVRATGNPHFAALWDFLGHVLKGTIATSRAWEARQESTRNQVRDEHRAMYAAIARQDGEAARAAARRHMEMAAQRIRGADPALLGKGGKPNAAVRGRARKTEAA